MITIRRKCWKKADDNNIHYRHLARAVDDWDRFYGQVARHELFACEMDVPMADSSGYLLRLRVEAEGHSFWRDTPRHSCRVMIANGEKVVMGGNPLPRLLEIAGGQCDDADA